MITDLGPLEEATKARKLVTLQYSKKTTGENVTHTGGVYEIGVNKAGNPCVWLWDTILNDHIRNFLISNIENFQVLDQDFIPPQPYPIKINGMEV